MIRRYITYGQGTPRVSTKPLVCAAAVQFLSIFSQFLLLLIKGKVSPEICQIGTQSFRISLNNRRGVISDFSLPQFT
jgi:hypothetical protein